MHVQELQSVKRGESCSVYRISGIVLQILASDIFLWESGDGRFTRHDAVVPYPHCMLRDVGHRAVLSSDKAVRGTLTLRELTSCTC